MLAELHCHSNKSHGEIIHHEGLSSVTQLIEHAIKLNIEVLAITDHDEIESSLKAMKLAKQISSDVLIIPGMEVTSADGHILVLGIEEKIPEGLSAEETVERARSLGAVTIAPHPFDIKNEGIKEKAKLCTAMESFNALNIDRISNFVAKGFAEKYNINHICGSDAHSAFMMGYCLNEIRASKDIDSVLKALKKGNVHIFRKNYIPIDVLQTWSVDRLKRSEDYVMDYMDENYRYPKRVVGKRAVRLVHRSPGNIDYFFDFLTYLGLTLAIPYSAVINLPKMRYLL